MRVIVTGKANIRHFQSGLARYVGSQKLEQFVLEYPVGCVFAHGLQSL